MKKSCVWCCLWQIHKDMVDELNYALVWGTSSKHYPQRWVASVLSLLCIGKHMYSYHVCLRTSVCYCDLELHTS